VSYDSDLEDEDVSDTTRAAINLACKVNELMNIFDQPETDLVRVGSSREGRRFFLS
jgi:hypothetical protein